MLSTLFRRWRRRRAPRAAILRYHRVTGLSSGPRELTVSPRHFAEHLAVIQERYAPVPLDRLVSSRAEEPFPDRSIALTFDDGYRDVVEIARPLLEEARIPATVFVVTGMVGAAREFWWDTLERIYPAPARPPAAIQTRFKSLDEPDRTALADRLLTEAGLEPTPRHDRRTLTAEDVTARRDDPWLSVGAHTVSHPMLDRLSPSRQWEEISESKAVLERLLGGPVTAFAYPYGSGTRLGGMVERAGFRCACTTKEKLFRAGGDRYRLPRIFVGDWPGTELARRLGQLGL